MAPRSAHLPIVIDIPEPCNESWKDMVGSERERRCARCEKQIHNLSALSQAEIAELVERENVCITYEVDARGELVTNEPRTPGARSHAGKVVLAAALSALAACGTETRVGKMRDPNSPPPNSAIVAEPTNSATSADRDAAPAPSTSATASAAANIATSSAPPDKTRTLGAPLRLPTPNPDAIQHKVGKMQRVTDE